MLIPCDEPLAEVVSAYLEAGDFTSSSRATYRRVLGELARDLGPQRPADSITGDELAAWFVHTRDAYALAYESAARASELLGLDVADLDLANRRAVVTSKGGARTEVSELPDGAARSTALLLGS
jgi:integrase